MKILLGVPEYPPFSIGGGAEVYRNLALQYRKLGHDVVVVYGYYPTKKLSETIKYTTDKAGISYYQIPEIPAPRILPYLKIRMPITPSVYQQLKQIVQKESPDIAHLHGHDFLFINLLSILLRKENIRYILTLHGIPIRQKQSYLFKIPWFFYSQTMLNKTFAHAKIITCVSRYLQQTLPQSLQKKSIVIPNGLSVQDYENVPNIDLRNQYAVDKQTLILLSLGRIDKMKGYQEVIKLLPSLLKTRSVLYLIAGEDAGYKKDLNRLIHDLHLASHVKFIGFLNHEQKKAYIKHCDVLAIPSLQEGFSLVALEGMFYDKVIMTTNTTGVKELLHNYKKTVYLYDRDILRQIEKKKLLQSIFDSQKYEYPTIAKQYLQTLQQTQPINT